MEALRPPSTQALWVDGLRWLLLRSIQPSPREITGTFILVSEVREMEAAQKEEDAFLLQQLDSRNPKSRDAVGRWTATTGRRNTHTQSHTTAQTPVVKHAR